MRTISKIFLVLTLATPSTLFTDICVPLSDKVEIMSNLMLKEMKQNHEKALVKLVKKILKVRAERNHYQTLLDEGNQEMQVMIDMANGILAKMDEKEKCLILRIKEIEAELAKRGDG
ncbi:hypothetical protein ACFLYU_05680 [Candidatus Dependentiae bacterium]